MSTIVLVGGSFLGGWAWQRVTPRLVAVGHEVYPVTLTGFGDRAHLGSPETTLGTHAEDIVAAIMYAGLTDVVLVAHSYAGAPATIAAARIPDRIARVVYVAGVLPIPGKSLFEVAGPDVEGHIMQAVDAEGDGWRIPVWSDFVLDNFFGEHGLSSEERAFIRDRATYQPVGTYRDPAPVDLSAVEQLPRTYIACTGDPGEPPVMPGVEIITLDSGHWPMITKPAELAALIDKAAEFAGRNDKAAGLADRDDKVAELADRDDEATESAESYDGAARA